MSETDPKKPGRELFAEFLETNQLTHQQAATALHKSRTVVWMWLHDHVSPNLGSRRDIAIWTKGAVPPDSWDVGKSVGVTPFEGKAPANGTEG